MKEITTLDEFQECLAESAQHPLFLFKHSTTCPISARAAHRLNDYLDDPDNDDLPDCYLIKVIESRPVSSAIETTLRVRHESPQLILLRDNNAVWNTSHGAIRAEKIDEALANHLATE